MFELKAYLYTTASLVVGLLLFRYCADRRLNVEIGKYFLPLMMVTQAAAFLSPDVVVYNVVVGAALLWGCGARRVIVPTYLFLLVTLPMAAKTMAAGGTYLMSYDISVSLGLAALIALAAKSRGHFPRAFAWDVPVVLLILIFLWANGRSTTATNILRVTVEQAAYLLMPYMVVSRSLRSFDDVRDGFYGLVAGVAAMSSLAIYEALHTWPLYRIVSDHYDIFLSGDASVKVRAGFLRSSGPFTEPTSFGYCLTLGVLAAIGCRRLFSDRTKRWIALGLLTVGILAPQSRGAWLGVAAGIIAMDLYDQRYGALAKKFGYAFLAGLLVLGAAKVDKRIESAAGLNAEGQGTVNYRTNLFDRGVEEIKAHPLIGRAPADVRATMRDMTQGEGIIDFVNTYLFIGLVAGIPGFLMFIVAFLQPLLALWQAKASFARRFLPLFRRMSMASLAFGGIVAVMVMVAVTSMTGRTTTLAVIQIAFASVILNNMRAARRAVRQPAIEPQGDAANAGPLRA